MPNDGLPSGGGDLEIEARILQMQHGDEDLHGVVTRGELLPILHQHVLLLREDHQHLRALAAVGIVRRACSPCVRRGEHECEPGEAEGPVGFLLGGDSEERLDYGADAMRRSGVLGDRYAIRSHAKPKQYVASRPRKRACDK